MEACGFWLRSTVRVFRKPRFGCCSRNISRGRLPFEPIETAYYPGLAPPFPMDFRDIENKRTQGGRTLIARAVRSAGFKADGALRRGCVRSGIVEVAVFSQSSRERRWVLRPREHRGVDSACGPDSLPFGHRCRCNSGIRSSEGHAGVGLVCNSSKSPADDSQFS
jgi:hypothetical protein